MLRYRNGLAVVRTRAGILHATKNRCHLRKVHMMETKLNPHRETVCEAIFRCRAHGELGRASSAGVRVRSDYRCGGRSLCGRCLKERRSEIGNPETQGWPP